MPDVCWANGFSETLRIGHFAAAHQVAVSPHVVHELSLHVVGALCNGSLVEFIDWAPADLFEGMPRCEDGHFRIPDRPGHGIALAAGAERKYGVQPIAEQRFPLKRGTRQRVRHGTISIAEIVVDIYS